MSTKMELEIINNWNNKIDCPTTKLFNKLNISSDAEHIGNKQFSPTSEWKKYNKQKSYAKTDIKIGNYKISLKSMNDHIMMSAKKNEAIATFMCVSNEVYKKNIPKFVNNIIDEMEDMITTAVSPTTIIQAKKLKDPIIKIAQEKHVRLQQSLEKLFDDPVFITFFLQEVLSGRLKFGDNSDGSATHILHITDKPTLHSLSDLSYISKLVNNVDFRIDFKSSKKTQGMEVGMYRYWSILQIINKQELPECVTLYENILSKIYSILKDVISYIKNNILDWSDLFSFMEIEPEITLNVK